MIVLSSYSGVLTKLCQLRRADLNETKRVICVLQAANPFFKLLTMLMEFAGGPPGMPPFASYILQRIWEVSFEAHASNLLFSQTFSFVVVFKFFSFFRIIFLNAKQNIAKLNGRYRYFPSSLAFMDFAFFYTVTTIFHFCF